MVQSSLAMTRGNVLDMEVVPCDRTGGDATHFYRNELESGRSLKQILNDLESRIIRDSLVRYGGNRSKTAEMLRVHRRYLYSKMKQYKIR